MDECSDPERWMGLRHLETDPMEIEESEEDTGPKPINWETPNANQRGEYEDEVSEYRRRIVRRLNDRADQAEVHNEFEEAEALRAC